VKTKSNKLMTFRAFSIGFSVAVLALACGSDSNGGEDDDPEIDVPRETCDDNPLLAECAGQLPDVDIDGNPIDRPEPPAPSGGDDGEDEPSSAEDLARAAAENVLASNCGQCHGPALDQQDASAGMNYIDDIQKLADEGKIIPLNSAGSRVVQRMRDGSMPPQQSQLPKVPDADINIVAQFIDNPRFWPGVEAGGGVCPDQLFTFDDLYREIAQDLGTLEEDDRLTARYITLTNRFTAGVCADDTSLDVDRQALSKLVNMLSTDTTVTPPEPIDADELIYRIDLTEYGWDDAISVVDADGNLVDFTDSWEAIAAFNPYAVPFEGQDADEAVEESGTAFPVMLADSLLDTASIGNLYYALIDVDVQQTLDDFILNELQIDVNQNLIDEEQVRAGTTRSRISRQDRVVQRDEIEIRQGVLWQSFDFEDDQNESIFESPFDFAEGGTEAIFTLPNGLFGFIIADENGLIVEDSDILLDTNQNNFRAVTSVSCSNCHAQGLIPVIDEVREIAIANARTSGLNADEVEQLRNVYPTAAEFARIVEGDSQSFYQNALARANVPREGVDPVSSVFFRFDQDITLEDAAGDLGLTPDELADELNILNPALGVLDQGRIDRDDFTQFYVDSLCELQIVAENQPVVELCDAVEANNDLVP
jgi:mono/diheme cytochrome c family protein